MSDKKPLVGEVLPAAASKVVPGANAITALNTLVTETSKYLTTREQERSKREEVRTYGGLEVERIRAAENILRGYFEHVFAERQSNFQELLARFDSAAASGDAHAMSQSLSAVVALAQHSPLADLGDLGQLRAALDDPNHVWRF